MTLRTAMTETAAFIDACRAAFGKAAIDAAIRKGINEGLPDQFHATENGHEAGTPFSAPGVRFTLADLDLWIPPKAKA